MPGVLTMEMRKTITTVAASGMRRLAAALAADLPPPGEIRPVAPTGTLCVHARDSGVPAFVNRPCRGNRIECVRTGLTTCAAACRRDECNYYEEDR